MAFLVKENNWILCECEDDDIEEIKHSHKDGAEIVEVPQNYDEICGEEQDELQRLFDKHKHQQ